MITRFLALTTIAAFVLLSAPADAASTITVSNVWSRPATGTGVVYATIHNSGGSADALVSASSPLAKAVELHQSAPVSSGMMKSSGSMSGMGNMPAVMMRPVRRIVIPAGGSATLKPGGYHIMLIGLHNDLKPGQTIPITLRFRNAGVVRVLSRVRPIAS